MNFRRTDILGLLLIGLALAPSVRAGSLRLIRTRHYEMHTDLPDDVARDMGVRMDAMYDEYAHRLSDFKPPTSAQSLPVYLFAKRDDYVAFTRSDHTAGVFWPGEKSYLASFLEGQGREEMRHTLQHEAFHQFAHFVVSPNLPTWLNEGIAELYNDAIWTGNRYIVGEIYPRRVRRIAEDIKQHRLIHLEKMITMDHKTWNDSLGAPDDSSTTYYNQAWAMVYFLTMSGRTAQTRQVNAYLKQLHEGADPTAAWKALFPDTQKLESQFGNWIMHVQPTSGGVLIEHQSVMADFYVFARQQSSFRNMTDFRNYVTQLGVTITYKAGGISWSTDRADVYFRDLQNQLWTESQLYFDSQGSGEPDIVCVADPHNRLRTRFYGTGASMEHELLFDH